MSRRSETHPDTLIDLSTAELRRRFEEGGFGPPSEVAESLRNEAARHFHSDPPRALRIARCAAGWAEMSGDPLALAWAHRAQAEALLFSGRMAQSESFYARAVDAARRTKATGLLGQILVARTHLLAMLGRYRDAGLAARQARRHLEAARDDTYLAKLAMNLGSVHFQREQHARALEEYDRAAAIFARSAERDATVLALDVNRGVVLSQLDRDDESLELFASLERECEKRGQELLLAQTRMNMAVVRSQRGEFDQALAQLAEAARYFRQSGHPAYLASCLLNRAEIYQQLNLSKEAGELAVEAVPLFVETGLALDTALARAQAAISRLEIGELKESLTELARARRIFVREKNASRVAVSDLLRAEALRRRGRRKEALELARSVVRRFQEEGLLRWESAAAVLVARMENEAGNPGRSIELLTPLLGKIPRRIYPLVSLQAVIVLGEAQEMAGRKADARRSYLRGVRRLDDLRIRIPTEDSKIAFLGDKGHLYDRLIGMELDRPRPSAERLFAWMERSREQSLRDRLRSPSRFLDASSERRVPAADEEGLPGLRRRLSWLHARLSRLELEGPARRPHALAVRRRLIDAEAGWAKALREAGEGRVGAAGEPGEIDDEDIRIETVARKLPPGWGFLSYHLAPGASLVFAVSEGRADWRRLDPRARTMTAALADRLDFQWSAAAMDAALAGDRSSLPGLCRTTNGLLDDAGGWLWDPVASMGFTPGTRWLVSPHGPLHRIPFHALRASGRYLAEICELGVVPGAKAWLAMPDPPAVSEGRAWIAGLPAPELPGVARETDRIARILGRGRAERDLRPTAAALRASGIGAAIVHLATHGSLREDNPAFSSIELADGPLFVHDLAGQRFSGSIIVLSACSSGGSAAPAAEEWIGIGRGFLLAGASTVVAPLWPIHEAPTLGLMEEFYRALSSGSDPITALGHARRVRLQNSRHPWEWAGFCVVGGLAKPPTPRSRGPARTH